jgi:hypothetical protein
MTIRRDRVTVTGPDARRYLHSQLSQDVESMRPGEERWSFALEPGGKVDVLAVVRCVDDETFELDTDAGYGHLLEQRLERFRIRVRAQLATVTVDVAGDPDEHERARVAAGWPAMGSEITPGETIPAETGITEAAVNFTKGCYPGQELVERMDSRRAAPPRQLRVVPAESAARVGDPIVDPDGGQQVGVLTSVSGEWAMGYVRRGSTVGAPPRLPSTA